MKKYLLCLLIISLLLPVLGFNAYGCNNDNSEMKNARVKLWITLGGNPDDPAVKELTTEQLQKASFWAKGTTEEDILIKVTLILGDKYEVLDTKVLVEGNKKVAAIGSMVGLAQPGSYVLRAFSDASGELLGYLKITVVQAAGSKPLPLPSN